METNTAILLAIVIPVAAAILNLLLRHEPDLRDSVTLAAAFATFAAVMTILSNVGNGTTEPLTLFEVFPGISVAFNVEPLGLLFAIVASGLWILTHIYAVGYMRGNNEENHSRFFAGFSLAIPLHRRRRLPSFWPGVSRQSVGLSFRWKMRSRLWPP